MRVALRILAAPDCMTFPCQQDCCSAGCDLWPREREALLTSGLGQESHFVGPYTDEEGDLLFRTAVGPRGCVFLQSGRGCSLHHTGLKPEVCVVAPRDPEEADEMRDEEMLPCHHSWRYEAPDPSTS